MSACSFGPFLKISSTPLPSIINDHPQDSETDSFLNRDNPQTRPGYPVNVGRSLREAHDFHGILIKRCVLNEKM